MSTEPEAGLESVASPPTRARTWRRRIRSLLSVQAARELVLTIGAIAGVLCLLSAAAAIAFDIKPVVFRSGSMSPAIDTGALAISRTVDASDLAVGDVVTVKTGTGVRVTHRIQDIRFADRKATLVLRGDANNTPDDKTYVVTSAPRVLFDIPKAGYVVSFASGPIGIFAGGLLVGVVMLTVFRRGGASPSPKSGSGSGSRAAFAAVAMLAVATSATFLGEDTTQTLAYYTDSATATTGTLDRILPAPAGFTCTVDKKKVVWSWTPVTNATGYDVSYTKAGVTQHKIVSGQTTSTVQDNNVANGTYTTFVIATRASDPGGTPSATKTFVVDGSSTGGTFNCS